MVIPPAAASIKIRVLPLQVLLTAGLGLRVIVSKMHLHTYILYMVHADLGVLHCMYVGVHLWGKDFPPCYCIFCPHTHTHTLLDYLSSFVLILLPRSLTKYSNDCCRCTYCTYVASLCWLYYTAAAPATYCFILLRVTAYVC